MPSKKKKKNPCPNVIPSQPNYWDQNKVRDFYKLSVQQLKDIRKKGGIHEKKYRNKIFLNIKDLDKISTGKSETDELKRKTGEANLKKIQWMNQETRLDFLESEYVKFIQRGQQIFSSLKDFPNKLNLSPKQIEIFNVEIDEIADNLQRVSEEIDIYK